MRYCKLLERSADAKPTSAAETCPMTGIAYGINALLHQERKFTTEGWRLTTETRRHGGAFDSRAHFAVDVLAEEFSHEWHEWARIKQINEGDPVPVCILIRVH